MMEPVTIKAPETTEAQAHNETIVRKANELVVSNQEEHGEALTFLQGVARAKKAVQGLFAEPKRAAHAAHRAICAAESELLQPLDRARTVAQGKALKYEQEARRRAEEERRRLAEEARKAEEERALADAEAAEAAGDHELAEQIVSEPVQAPAPVVAPETARVSGVSSRSTWRAEVVDLAALVKYVAAHPEWANLLVPNQTALSALARSQKDRLAIPGVRAVEERGLAVGAGR